jgi:hypothetical protein
MQAVSVVGSGAKSRQNDDTTSCESASHYSAVAFTTRRPRDMNASRCVASYTIVLDDRLRLHMLTCIQIRDLHGDGTCRNTAVILQFEAENQFIYLSDGCNKIS